MLRWRSETSHARRGNSRSRMHWTCGGPPAAPPAQQGGDVEWGDYVSSLKGRLDALAQTKDCAGLQTEFNTADANNAATMNRVGHNNAKLMAYIDAQMKASGCY
jgi:hypothetical protein